MTQAEAIKQEARRLGFDAVGISRVASDPASLPDSLYARLREWLDRGYEGAMGWMARRRNGAPIRGGSCPAAGQSCPSA